MFQVQLIFSQIHIPEGENELSSQYGPLLLLLAKFTWPRISKKGQQETWLFFLMQRVTLFQNQNQIYGLEYVTLSTNHLQQYTLIHLTYT